ncbi:hypothetical protein [Halostella sp. PRR32]|uniref:DUF7344 domain-containing protein n=1 Tax=Halostella sp. PRR32 TaxID=3098147 RepID=UPI002B1E7A6D|nr:hypothetical protein [Halostella sp. PRR32]
MKSLETTSPRKTREEISEKTVVDAIQNQRRRYVLYYLQNHDRPIGLDELIDQVAAWERCTTPDEVSPSHRKSVYSAIHQTHLPYLEDLELVSYNRQRKQISLRVDRSEFGLYLVNDPHTTVPWYKVYFTLALTCLTAAGLILLGIWPVETLPVISVFLLFAVAFALTSVFHWLDIYRWRRRTKDMPPDFVLTLGNDVSGSDGNNDAEDNFRSENNDSGGKRG